MSHFLQNLITRHQPDHINLESTEIVQPRPKSRFETDQGVGNYTNFESDNNTDSVQAGNVKPADGSILTQTDFAIPSESAESGQEFSNQSSVSSQHVSEMPINQFDADNHSDDLDARIASLKLKATKKPMIGEPPIHSLPNFPDKQTLEEPRLDTFEKSSNSLDLSLTETLNQRIQTILNRLNSPVIEQNDELKNNQTEPHPLSDNRNQVVVQESHSGIHSKPELNSIQSVMNIKEQAEESRSSQYDANQFGLLQPPNWLAEIQSKLNNRWQQIQDHTKPDPVVNVTIGRVEVRAINAESPKQPKPRNKPTGVMNLDDYLKQRGRKRSL